MTQSRAKRKHNFIVDIRTSHEATVKKVTTDENSPASPVKNTVLLEFFSPNSQQKIQKQLENEVPTYTPLKEIKERSERGSPITGVTRSGTIVWRYQNTSVSSFFTNRHHALTQVNQTTTSQHKMDPDVYEAPSTCTKEMHIHLDAKLLAIIQKKLKKQGKYRSQNATMATGKAENASARKHADFHHELQNVEVEWLHLIAFAIIGHDGQDTNNLVLGTKAANTDMLILIETHLKKLLAVYPDGLDLTVCAELKENTHIATNIRYLVKHNDDTVFETNFNPQTPNQPHYDMYRLAVIIMENYCEKLMEKNQKNVQPTHLPTP